MILGGSQAGVHPGVEGAHRGRDGGGAETEAQSAQHGGHKIGGTELMGHPKVWRVHSSRFRGPPHFCRRRSSSTFHSRLRTAASRWVLELGGAKRLPKSV